MAYPVKDVVVKEAGNGSKVEFEFEFLITAKTDINVYKGTIADDVAGDALLLYTDYDVEIYTDRPGGKVTYVAAPTTLQQSIIESNVPNSATIAQAFRGRISDVQLQAAFHRTAVQAQQLEAKLERCLKVDVGSSTDAETYLESLFDDISEANGSANKTAAEAAQAAAEASAVASAASASAAASSATDAQTAQGLAEAAAGSINMPDPTGNGLELLRANAAGTAPEYSGVTVSTDGSLTDNVDTKVPTEKAVKTYVAAAKAAATAVAIESRTSDPTGGDLYAGRIWFRSNV